MNELELLAPARNTEIGIAAIGCGADAVYIAGPAFGARKDAGNSIDDIKRLCDFAHIYGARVFVTLNTILFEDETETAKQMLKDIEDAGADGFIVQDLGVLSFGARVPLHASTQCAIRTPEKARFMESLGFARVVMERQTSLEQIKAVRKAIDCEIEYFVHGALCVSYSGQCYMSEFIDGRSANRGACIQACRSLYDLCDDSGKTLIKNKALLSLKDYNLISRLEELADAGVASFKIEGRLKNISYVRNVVRAYSIALDEIVAKHPDKYRRASFGKVSGGFTPSLDKTFNRGYTSLFIDGQRGKWSSMNAPKSMGEFIGTVKSIQKEGHNLINIKVSFANDGITLQNGDGFAFVSKDSIVGFRADVCQGNSIRCKSVSGISVGAKLYRNISTEFEKRLEADQPKRFIDVSVNLNIVKDNGVFIIETDAKSEDGREVSVKTNAGEVAAQNPERMISLLQAQLSKKTDPYGFTLSGINNSSSEVPHLPASEINAIRRSLAERLDKVGCNKIPLAEGKVDSSLSAEQTLSYKANISNSLAASVYSERGSESISGAYELSHEKGVELMRMKYCIRYELGMCPKQGAKAPNKLFLLNNGRKFELGFDCKNCEMTVKEA